MFADIISEEDAELAALQECIKCSLIAVHTRMFSHHPPPPEHILLNELPDQLSQQLKSVIKKRFRLRQKAEEPAPAPEPEPKEEPKNLKPALDIFLWELKKDISNKDNARALRSIDQFEKFISDKTLTTDSWSYDFS